MTKEENKLAEGFNLISTEINELRKENLELKQKYDKLLKDVHHILVSPHRSDEDCLDEMTMYFRELGV